MSDQKSLNGVFYVSDKNSMKTQSIHCTNSHILTVCLGLLCVFTLKKAHYAKVVLINLITDS